MDKHLVNQLFNKKIITRDISLHPFPPSCDSSWFFSNRSPFRVSRDGRSLKNYLYLTKILPYLNFVSGLKVWNSATERKWNSICLLLHNISENRSLVSQGFKSWIPKCTFKYLPIVEPLLYSITNWVVYFTEVTLTQMKPTFDLWTKKCIVMWRQVNRVGVSMKFWRIQLHLSRKTQQVYNWIWYTHHTVRVISGCLTKPPKKSHTCRDQIDSDLAGHPAVLAHFVRNWRNPWKWKKLVTAQNMKSSLIASPLIHKKWQILGCNLSRLDPQSVMLFASSQFR